MFMKMNNMINNFSVVIPVFNEEEIFLDSANKIYKLCEEMNMPFEIIFSENGSSDNTVNLIDAFINKKDNCFIIQNEVANYGLALKHGFKIAKNDYFEEKRWLTHLLRKNESVRILVSCLMLWICHICLLFKLIPIKILLK